MKIDQNLYLSSDFDTENNPNKKPLPSFKANNGLGSGLGSSYYISPISHRGELASATPKKETE